MSFRAELNKHLSALPVAEVKKLVSKYNKELDIKPISKLKKEEILEKIRNKKPMNRQLLAKLTNEARATVEGRKAQKASEKEDAKKKKEEPKKKVIRVKKSKNQPPKAKPDFLDLDKDGDKKEPMKKAAAEAKKEEPKKKVIKVKKSKNEPLSKENREIKSELRKIMNKHFGGIVKVSKQVLSGKVKDESREEEELLDENDYDTNQELVKLAKKYKIPKTEDTEFFESDRGFEKVTRLQALKNSKIDLETLPNYNKLTEINKKLDEKFEKEEQQKKQTKKPKKKAEPKKKMPSGVHIHLDGKTMKYNSVKEGQASFNKIRSNRAKKPYKKMTLMENDKVLDYSA